MGKKKTEHKSEKAVLTFTVAECGEYHNLGEYHEGIKTLEEAVTLYRKMPHERINGIPSIGINIHVEGTDKIEDVQTDILSGNEINTGCLSFPEFCENPRVQQAVNEIIRLFPDKEMADY